MHATSTSYWPLVHTSYSTSWLLRSYAMRHSSVPVPTSTPTLASHLLASLKSLQSSSSLVPHITPAETFPCCARTPSALLGCEISPTERAFFRHPPSKGTDTPPSSTYDGGYFASDGGGEPVMSVARASSASDPATDAFDRLSLCFSTPERGVVSHGGQAHFTRNLHQFYPAAESNAAEKVVQLKSRLVAASKDEFWATVTKGIADAVDAQYAFISKRVLVNDQDVPVEMPPMGEKGSCLMGMAYYWNDGRGADGTAPNIKYEAYAAPCAYMKHDKVFIIPANCDTFLPHEENPNADKLVNPIASYIAVPLFSEGKCFAHFGVSWSEEGERNRKLGWGFLEMLLHTLEDIVLQRVLEGSGLGHKIQIDIPSMRPVVPHQAVAPSQSLKPYARSLSHELRTPMQGVVGMLDVMHASVQEAMEGVQDPHLQNIFATLRENIETVQDSSRRAVEAADNVVHAYDMNMGVPEIVSPVDEEDVPDSSVENSEGDRPGLVVTGSHTPSTFNQSRKRRRGSIRHTEHKRRKSVTEHRDRPAETAERLSRAEKRMSPHHMEEEVYREDFAVDRQPILDSPPFISEYGIVPGLRHTNLRDVMHYVVNDGLRVGGRPDSAIAEPTDNGEIIEVRIAHPSGVERVKIIEWEVDPAVPETMLIDEKDFAKMISCVFLNALKFTEEGRISLTARLTPKSRSVLISCTDSGPGIPVEFIPSLFKPFSQKDDSLTRKSEGLGLGLLVARGLARKLGGDLVCVRAETEGPGHGCDFELRVPITPSNAISRPGTPSSSPAPSRRSRLASAESEGMVSDLRSSAPFRKTDSPQPSNGTAPTSVPTSIGSPRSTLLPSPAPHSAHPPTFPVTHKLTHEPSVSSRQLRKDGPPASPQLLALQPASFNPRTPRHQSAQSRAVTSVKAEPTFDRNLAKKHPLTFLVAEDNKINRRLLVNMLGKLGYSGVYEAYDGADAVRQMDDLITGKHSSQGHDRTGKRPGNGKMVDVVLMDLWMPLMDGYEATQKILAMANGSAKPSSYCFRAPTILAVTADVTDGALDRATAAGMKGFMTKPYLLKDLEKLIVEFATRGPHAVHEH